MSSSLTDALRILVQWQCTPRQATTILGLDPDLPFPDYPSDEQRERITFVLNIHSDLGTIFPNPEDVYGYMARPHHDPYYGGMSPLALISDGDLSVFEHILWHIDSMRTC